MTRFIVITGKDKGKRGIVLSVGEERVTVEGINLVKKHVKPNPMKGTTGGVEAKTMPLHISNVALVDANGKAIACGHQGRERQEGTLLEVDRCHA